MCSLPDANVPDFICAKTCAGAVLFGVAVGSGGTGGGAGSKGDTARLKGEGAGLKEDGVELKGEGAKVREGDAKLGLKPVGTTQNMNGRSSNHFVTY